MNEQAEFVIEWIEALASNDYDQCRGTMSDSLRGDDYREERYSPDPRKDSFCCLGVAREVAREFGFSDDIPPQEKAPKNPYADVEEVWSSIDLSSAELRAFGLNTEAVSTLIAYNDEEHLPFSAIARRILKKPAYFFRSDIAEAVEDYFLAGAK